MSTMRTLHHVGLEHIDSRYTAQWAANIGKSFLQYADAHQQSWRVFDIVPPGHADEHTSDSGGFLNFTDTWHWKSQQVQIIANLFKYHAIAPGDVFLFTDAWNPSVLAVRYMSDLCGIPVGIVGLWHAGSYDPWDILGQRIHNTRWSFAAEAAFAQAFDRNVFATEFHRNFFARFLRESMHIVLPPDSLMVSGQPHAAVIEAFPQPFDQDQDQDHDNRQDVVVFPHRLSPEKQPEIFEALAPRLLAAGITPLMTGKSRLPKAEYYAMLRHARVAFSCAQHEFLGIAMMEATLAGCIPVVPDRLSYAELFFNDFRYPSAWSDPGSLDLDKLADLLIDTVRHYDEQRAALPGQIDFLRANYLDAAPTWQAIINLTPGVA